MDGSDAGGADGILAGDRHEHYYYAGWRVVEQTDNAAPPRTLAQTTWGVTYIDEPLTRDRNSDPATDNGCLDAGGSQRYFYHEDANHRIIALSDESADVVERYEYSAYGEPRIYAGGDGESGERLFVSSVGNPYMHQSLRRDDETGLHENRMRVLNPRLGRFMQRDPLEYSDSLNLYEYVESGPFRFLDPMGLKLVVDQRALRIRKIFENILRELCSDARVDPRSGDVTIKPPDESSSPSPEPADDPVKGDDSQAATQPTSKPSSSAACAILRDLINSDTTVTVVGGWARGMRRSPASFDPKTNTLHWRGLGFAKKLDIDILGSKKKRKPTEWEVIWHELIHAQRAVMNRRSPNPAVEETDTIKAMNAIRCSKGIPKRDPSGHVDVP